MNNCNFFKALSGLAQGTDLTITIKMENERMIVSILPKPVIEDASKHALRPIIMRGAPAEIDEHFLNTLTAPLNRVQEWSVEMQNFERDMQRAQEESRKEEHLKKERKAKTDKADKKLEKAENLVQEGKYGQALAQIDEALRILPDYPKAVNKQQSVRAKAGMDAQASMFTQSSTNQ